MTTQNPLENASKTLGIIGGGQLALMLAMAAQKIGIEVLCLAQEANEPIVRAGLPHLIGRVEKNSPNLTSFLSKVGTVIFENEFINTEELRNLSVQYPVLFLPHLSTMELLSNKLTQKYLCLKLGISTADFEVFSENPEDPTEIKKWFSSLLKKFKNGFVLKWSRLGYDGKGNFVCRSESEFSEALIFCGTAFQKNISVYAEELIDFSQELAMIACRALTGETIIYPLVLSRQESATCKVVKGPATSLGVSTALELEAASTLSLIGSKTNLVGTFAVEFFQTKDGKLLLNEIAPRVHNSAHYSIDACETSQFENHIRATTGKPFGKIGAAKAFLMYNLLGSKTGGTKKIDPESVSKQPLPTSDSYTCKLMWYLKDEVKPQRKMGHINVVGTSLDSLDAAEKALAVYEENFWKSI